MNHHSFLRAFAIRVARAATLMLLLVSIFSHRASAQATGLIPMNVTWQAETPLARQPLPQDTRTFVQAQPIGFPLQATLRASALPVKGLLVSQDSGGFVLQPVKANVFQKMRPPVRLDYVAVDEVRTWDPHGRITKGQNIFEITAIALGVILTVVIMVAILAGGGPRF